MQEVVPTLPDDLDVEWLRQLTPDETATIVKGLEIVRRGGSEADALAWQMRLEAERAAFKAQMTQILVERSDIKEVLVNALLQHAQQHGCLPRKQIQVDSLSEGQLAVLKNDPDLYDAATAEAKRRRRTAQNPEEDE